jgi:hypothetical protein
VWLDTFFSTLRRNAYSKRWKESAQSQEAMTHNTMFLKNEEGEILKLGFRYLFLKKRYLFQALEITAYENIEPDRRKREKNWKARIEASNGNEKSEAAEESNIRRQSKPTNVAKSGRETVTGVG